MTQKARLDDPLDGYRAENAQPADWVMAGNHDTPPLARVIERWHAAGEAPARAAYLAERLEPEPARRAAFVNDLVASRAAMAEAMIADLFACPARNVLVFFADLFGIREVFNQPGVVHPENWTLRVPHDYRAVLAKEIAAGRAPHLGRALALAMHARGLTKSESHRVLQERLCAFDFA